MDVERQIRNALEARLEKLAPTELKNISVPMDLYRIVLPWEQRAPAVGKPAVAAKSKPGARARAAAITGVLLLVMIGTGWWWTTRSRERSSSASLSLPEKSLAVLPFENLTRDPETI